MQKYVHFIMYYGSALLLFTCKVYCLKTLHTQWTEPWGQASAAESRRICGSAGKDVFCGINQENPGGLAVMYMCT